MFNPEKFIEIGKKILSQTKLEKEARIRTSISRTYHGALLISKEKLEKKYQASFNNNDMVHREVIEKLKEIESTLGDKLETLNEYREEADLSLDSNHDITDATHCSGIADFLLNQLKRF